MVINIQEQLIYYKVFGVAVIKGFKIKRNKQNQFQFDVFCIVAN